eukprot:scaffold10051_cov94-Skeletonema_dohrnii-CCMP3373.AAC.3
MHSKVVCCMQCCFCNAARITERTQKSPCDSLFDSYVDFDTTSDKTKKQIFHKYTTSKEAASCPSRFALHDYLVTCKHQLHHLLAALFYLPLMLNHSANGFLGSSCSSNNNNKLMARKMRLIATNTPSSPMLAHSSCLYTL